MPRSSRLRFTVASRCFISCCAIRFPSRRGVWRGDYMSLVKVEKLEKYFGQSHILKGVDLNVEKGQVVAIIGRSGSGKSTLLRCLNGLETFESGVILIEEREVGHAKTDMRKLRQKVGMVFQQFNLFPHLTAG